jgi:hypothetical protein
VYPVIEYHADGGPALLRCSIADNEAIISDSLTGSTRAVYAIALDTGKRTRTTWQPRGNTTVVAVSGNGRYAVEADDGASGSDRSGRIVDTRTGAQVGRVKGLPSAISWNGRYVVVTRADGILAVIDWRSGHELWRSGDPPPSTGGAVLIGFGPAAEVAARPHSDDLALCVTSMPGQPQGQAVLFLVNDRTKPRVLTDIAVAGAI